MSRTMQNDSKLHLNDLKVQCDVRLCSKNLSSLRRAENFPLVGPVLIETQEGE
jgi:hypothetical protein